MRAAHWVFNPPITVHTTISVGVWPRKRLAHCVAQTAASPASLIYTLQTSVIVILSPIFSTWQVVVLRPSSIFIVHENAAHTNVLIVVPAHGGIIKIVVFERQEGGHTGSQSANTLFLDAGQKETNVSAGNYHTPWRRQLPAQMVGSF